MKLVLDLSITADGVQDYEDMSEQMGKLMRRFNAMWRDDATLSVGDTDTIIDSNGNNAGKWEIVP